MLLSSISVSDGKLLRDGEFSVLALSNSLIDSDILSFLDDRKFINEINDNPNIKCVITKKEFVDALVPRIKGIYVTERPRREYFILHNQLTMHDEYVPRPFNTSIGESCRISPLAYIEEKNVIIGNNVVIDEFVSIRGRVVIGDDVRISAGVSIGSSGFEFKRDGDEVIRIIHVGCVEIGNHVDISNGVTIHTAVYPWDRTAIGEYTKINAQVHIDHGVKVGNNVFIGAGAIISGRSQINKGSYIGPGVVVSNRLTIGKNAKASIGSIVTLDVKDNSTVTGNFAIPHDLFIKRLKTDLSNLK